MELTYLKQGAEGDGEAGDKYAGLDRFGRIRDQRWLKTSDGTARDRFEYGYDRNSNRLYEKNLVDGAFSELYHANGASAGYDSLNQISEFRRGTLSDANSDGVPDTITTSSRTQVWSYDPLGNWSTVTNDGTAQNRTHNRQNQITSITSLTTPTYDSNGNMIGDENGKTLVYDAWNRLVDFKNGGTSLEAYKYDALNRRVEENPGTARALFYTAEWQVIEERTSGVARVSYVWSPVYIDALIVRDRDSDTNGSLEERFYVAHDANWNVSSILNSSAAVQERYIYDSFGAPSFKDASYGARGSSSYGWTRLFQSTALSATTAIATIRNREYSPQLGRWLQNDPLSVDSGDSNFLRAFNNDPIVNTDPQGLCSQNVEGELTDELCCIKARDKNLHITIDKRTGKPTPSAGGVICCNGKKVSCSWKSFPPYYDGIAIAVIQESIHLHERVHFPIVADCPRRGITRPFPIKPGDEFLNASECEAYKKQIAFLRKEKARCDETIEPTRTRCRDQIQNHIDLWIQIANSEYGCKRS